ncbi:MAG: YfiR family protein [bacterium]|jgi:hypothetical protein
MTGRQTLPRKILGMLMLLLPYCNTSPVLSAVTENVTEYDLKAVFIYNFLQFVEWPSFAFDSAQAPFVIGVYGNNPFGNALENVASGEVVRNRQIRVKYLTQPEQISQCHILYVKEETDYEKILPETKGKPILSVGETYRFLSEGGVIQFYIREDKVRGRINLRSARDGQLKIGSQLLRVFDVINKD